MRKNKKIRSLSGHKFDEYKIGDNVHYGQHPEGTGVEHEVIGMNMIEELLCIQEHGENEKWVRFENTYLLPF